MSNEISTTAEISLPRAFHFDEVRALPRDTAAFTGRPAGLAQLMATLTEAAVGGGDSRDRWDGRDRQPHTRSGVHK